MAADHEPEAGSFDHRLAKWTRDSAELRESTASKDGEPSEDVTVRRYERSRTSKVSLPHPALSSRSYDELGRQLRTRGARLAVVLLLAPLLVVLGVLVGPVAAKVALWALLAPLAALAVYDARALATTAHARRLVLRGGLADAWSDWVTARARLEALDGAGQARAALAVNEARLQALVLSLARAEERPGHQDTAEQADARSWVHRTAAKAAALAAAEDALESATQGRVDAGELELAPDGDIDALDQALGTARELTGRTDDPLA